MDKKQHTLWLLAALAAPVAHDSGCGWAVAGLAALTVLPLCLIPKSWEDMTGFQAVIQLFWLGTVAGMLLQNSAIYWPSDNGLAVPLTILSLAGLTDSAAGPRIGAVLAFCMALLAVPAAVAGAATQEPEWLRPVIAPWPWTLTLIFLLPNLPAAGMAAKGRGLVYAGVLGMVLALLVQGTISPEVAASVPDPFWQTARTLGYLEPVIAVGITFGWYALTVYLLQSARKMARSAGIKSRWAGVLPVGTAVAVLLFKWQLGYPIMTLFSSFLWVLSPFLSKIKKVEKT